MSGAPQRAAIRGGNWNNGPQAGVFALNLNNGPSNRNTNIGFRCVSPGAGVHDVTNPMRH